MLACMKRPARLSKSLMARCLTLPLAATLAACAGGTTQPPQVEQVAQPGSAEAKAELALRLAAQARRDGDARAMLVAARLMLTSGTRPASLQEGELGVEAGVDPVAAGWAREAMIFAAGDPAMVAEAEAVLAMRPRGVLRSSLGAGPLRYVRRVPANRTISFNIRTEPQMAARVAAIGDGDARIGLSVSSASAAVCRHTARTTHSLCVWQARADRHDVQLQNAGPLDSDVMLLSN